MTVVDTLLVRVDASPEIGLGHGMRCLALAQGWKDAGGDVCFALAESLPAFEQRLKRERFEIVPLPVRPGTAEDASRTAAVARERQAPWVVVDGYRFGPAYQRTVKESGTRLLIFDDRGHAGDYSADLVLNQNISARPETYSRRASHTRLLLGPRYVMLQRNFRMRRPAKRKAPPIGRKFLVTIGGVDAHNVTLNVIRVLERTSIDSLEGRIVLGGGNPHLESLEAAVRASPGRLRLERDPPDMSELMAWADLAIGASGTTSWELAYMGVPSLLIATADNQREVAESLDRAGMAKSLGWHEALTESRLTEALREIAESRPMREEMSRRGRELVDGQGVPRVLAEMKASLLALRPVTERDARLLWEWANDRSVRSVSFTPDSIPWENHVKWFEAKRKDPNCRFYLAVDPLGVPLGQIRFDAQGEAAEVSVSLDARFRSRGYGSALILAGSRKVFDESRVKLLHAYVKEGNEASVRAFVRAGYQHAGLASVRGQQAIHLVLRKETPA
ncbi:MAG: UDP-2,4-diacetamido-2,4,6-trideoxy-beta-L-altropyranose hydrolase [Euryarchaeota archaeon RBG_16_68_13]|nr:MAG: UDP-2,4-diacetamido-2,4,6-trideoxy-beta-L-altropyranose hydrolase [Euryarchaeota archaeon RBG_16_68_13]